MSDALNVLLVPDADDTTRRVLRALRAAALAEAPVAEREASTTMLLRWDRPAQAPVKLGDDLQPVRDAEGAVLYYESTLTELDADVSESAKPAAHAHGEAPFIAPLLAFTEAVERVQTIGDVGTAAIVATEQVLGADAAVVLYANPDPRASVELGACSHGIPEALQTEFGAEAFWNGYRLPRIATATDSQDEVASGLVPRQVRRTMEETGAASAMCLPLKHNKLSIGAVWALYAQPTPITLELRQRGGLLAHHLAGVLAQAQARLRSAEEAAPAREQRAQPSAAELPLKALISLASEGAYGLERMPDGSLAVAWATKSLRTLMGLAPDAPLDTATLFARIPEPHDTVVRATLESLPWNEPVRVAHPMTVAEGEAKRFRHALQRVRRNGHEQIFGVLVEVDGGSFEAEREQAEPERDAFGESFLASLTEALRVPLATLLHQANGLATAARMDDIDVQSTGRRIADQGRHLMTTLNLVVDVARIESGDVHLECEDLDLVRELAKVVGLLAPLAEKKGTPIELSYNASLQALVCQEQTTLSRVLHHVVGSTIARVGEGALRVEVQQADGMVRLALEGVVADEAPQSTATFGDTIAERLVAQMGGAIEQVEEAGQYRCALSMPGEILETPASDEAEATAERDQPEAHAPTGASASRRFASIEDAANAFRLADAELFAEDDTRAPAATSGADDAEETSADAVSEVETSAATVDAPASTDAAEHGDGAATKATASYSRTEIALPVGVRMPATRPRRKPDAVSGDMLFADPLGGVEPSVPARPAPTTQDEDSGSDAEPGMRVDALFPVPKGEATSAPLSTVLPLSSVKPPPVLDSAPHAFDTALDGFAFIEPNALDEAPPVASEPINMEQRPRVLIVEDNYETRILLETLIGREFDAVAVETPRAALDQLTRNQFDALILDIHLGGRETGADILRIARTLDGYSDTYAMAVTAFGSDADRDRFLRAGFQAYVQKPFETETLLAPLRAALAPAGDA